MWECRPSEVGEDWFSTYQAAGSPAPAQIIYSAEHTRKEPIINHCPSAPSRFPSIPTKPSPVKVSPCETKSNLGMPRVAFLYLLGFDGISFFSICLGGVWGAADPDACMREDCHMRAHVLHIHLMCLTFLLWLRIIWHRALVDDGNDLQWRHCYKNHVYYKWSSSWDILRMLPPVHSVSIHRSSQPWTPSLAWSKSHYNIYCKAAGSCHYITWFALRLWPDVGGVSQSSTFRLRQCVCLVVPADVGTPMIYTITYMIYIFYIITSMIHTYTYIYNILQTWRHVPTHGLLGCAISSACCTSAWSTCSPRCSVPHHPGTNKN